jgi:hypothetical protein
MSEERLVPVPIPPLVQLLQMYESQKGAPLTRDEVEQVRRTAICMTMRESAVRALEEKRGFRDIDPENAWEEWLAYRGHRQ